MVEGNTVCGDESAGAVFAKLAMYKNFLRGCLAEKREKFCELRGTGRGETVDRDGNEVDIEGFRKFSLLIASLAGFTAEINDGSDAKCFELGKVRKMRLGATKERIGNFSGVGYSGNRDFLGDRQRG